MKNINPTIKDIITKISVPKHCPYIILQISPSRSGSTSQVRVFAQAGIPAWYQPLKAILRGFLDGQDIHFSFPDTEDPIFIKEAIGPYTKIESEFNPLDILLQAGVPKKKIYLISL